MGQESEEGERETEKRERGERSKRNKEEVEKEEEEVEKTMRAIEWPKRRTDAIQSFRLLSFCLSFSRKKRERKGRGEARGLSLSQKRR